MKEKINKLTKDENILSTLDESLIDKIISLKEERKTYKEISDITGFSKYIIGKVVRKEDLSNSLKFNSLNVKLIKEIKRLYSELKSTRKVAKELGVSRDTVRKYVDIHTPTKLSDGEIKVVKVKAVIDWRRRTKIKLVEYKGGKCELCGYSKCYEALEFHHKDPKEKDFSISGNSRSFDRLKVEVDKCMLVCANCHREIHVLNHNKNIVENLSKLEEWKNKIDDESENCVCGKAKTKSSEKCVDCFRKEQYDKKPKLEVLLKDVEELGYCGTGRKYGVSDNAIRKWIKSIIKFEEKV